MGGMSGMTSGALARLAFWARGMTAIRDGRMEWPGFSYSDAEWARMRTLAAPIGAGRYHLALIGAAVTMAALLILHPIEIALDRRIRGPRI